MSSSSSETDVITASGYDYNIDVASGLGGVVAQLTPVTKIVDEKTILDVIASIPNFNNYKLESITNNGDTWDAKINKDGNEYVTSSAGANTAPFKFNTKNGNTYYLKPDIKKGSNGTPDVATYATVELQDNNNVHIKAGVWTSKTASHAPFYAEVVSR